MSPAPLRLLVALRADDDQRRALLTVAADLARRLDAEIHVLHVIGSPDMQPVPAIAAPLPAALVLTHGSDPVPNQTAAHDAALLRLHRDMEGSAELQGRPWTAHVLAGPAASQIADLADEIDAYVIIIGAPRRGILAAWGHLVDGSVTRELGQCTSRPVLHLSSLGDEPERPATLRP